MERRTRQLSLSSKPGLSAAEVPRLKVKWAFGFPGIAAHTPNPPLQAAEYSWAAPLGRCTHWTQLRGARIGVSKPMVAFVPPSALPGRRPVAVILPTFGDLRAMAYAVDASTGALIWKVKLDNHPSRASPAHQLLSGPVFVPMASFEEAAGSDPKSSYECCTFRGSLTALDAETGRQLWKSFTVLDPPKAYKKNKIGGQKYGPAGADLVGSHHRCQTQACLCGHWRFLHGR